MPKPTPPPPDQPAALPSAASVVAYRYVGPGWAMGVPARDLTPDDVAALDPTLWAEALDMGLYVAAEPEKEV